MAYPRPPLLLLAALLGLSQCKKDDPEAALPEATQTGANTAGCLINGQAFVATGWDTGLLSGPIKPLNGGFAFDSIYYLRLNGQLKGVNTTVTLYFYSPKTHKYPKNGVYYFNSRTQYYPQAIFVLNHATYTTSDNSNEVYVTDAQHTGQVVLTRADTGISIAGTIHNFSAGTFEFTAASQTDPRKTVTITNGRFDRAQ